MTSFELGNLIKRRLGDAGLLGQDLNEGEEQYLEFPEGFFAEIVLNDGSKLPIAERAVKSAEEELRKQGIRLDAIVRARWELASVEKAVTYPVPGTGQRFAVTLRSGAGECKVTVNVTSGADNNLYAAFRNGDLREYGDDRDAVLREIVSQLVRFELSHGGESYWDPISHPELTLNEDALEYLTMHRPTRAG